MNILLLCYRDAVFHIENAISDGEQLEFKGMTDEQQRTYLESVRRSRFKTLIMTALKLRPHLQAGVYKVGALWYSEGSTSAVFHSA